MSDVASIKFFACDYKTMSHRTVGTVVTALHLLQYLSSHPSAPPAAALACSRKIWI